MTDVIVEGINLSSMHRNAQKVQKIVVSLGLRVTLLTLQNKELEKRLARKVDSVSHHADDFMDMLTKAAKGKKP